MHGLMMHIIKLSWVCPPVASKGLLREVIPEGLFMPGNNSKLLRSRAPQEFTNAIQGLGEFDPREDKGRQGGKASTICKVSAVKKKKKKCTEQAGHALKSVESGSLLRVNHKWEPDQG